jgi:hypothetical protein
MPHQTIDPKAEQHRGDTPWAAFSYPDGATMVKRYGEGDVVRFLHLIGQKRFTGFIRDVPDRRKVQAVLMQSGKLALVAGLDSSMAHEINNLRKPHLEGSLELADEALLN